MMDEQLTLRVRPGETVRFPDVCVACEQPATERLPLLSRRGQITRRIDVPLCADCTRRLARRSGREEQLLRIRWLAAVVATILLMVLVLVVLPLNPWWFRLVVGLAASLAGGAFIYWAVTRRAEAAELPERRTVRESARIADFTWRDMTLAFANRAVAERVRVLNPDYVGEESLAGLSAVSGPALIAEKPAQEISVPPTDDQSV